MSVSPNPTHPLPPPRPPRPVLSPPLSPSVSPSPSPSPALPPPCQFPSVMRWRPGEVARWWLEQHGNACGSCSQAEAYTIAAALTRVGVEGTKLLVWVTMLGREWSKVSKQHHLKFHHQVTETQANTNTTKDASSTVSATTPPIQLILAICRELSLSQQSAIAFIGGLAHLRGASQCNGLLTVNSNQSTSKSV